METLREVGRDTKGLFVVAEDHYPEGGIAAAVLEALANDAQRPRITPGDMMSATGISAGDITSAPRTLLRETDKPN